MNNRAMATATVAQGEGESAGHRSTKPRVSYADLQIAGADWMKAFESIRANGVREGFTVEWQSESPHPAWLQVKVGKERKMVRRGDPLIFEMVKP